MPEQFEQDDREALTDAEWREFQGIPEQGYSHRHWVDSKIRERLARRPPAPQQVSTIAEVADADVFPDGTILRGSDGDVFEIRHGGVTMTGVTGKFSLNWITFPATVLYRPEGGESA